MLDLAGEDAVNRVILEEMRQGSGICQIIDRHKLEIFVLARRPQNHPSDSAETIDCNP
jgi:hypothetical protein